MTLQERRKGIINQIIQTLKKAKETDREIIEKKLLAKVSYDNNCSLRTAQEYLKIARNVA